MEQETCFPVYQILGKGSVGHTVEVHQHCCRNDLPSEKKACFKETFIVAGVYM